MSSKSTLKYPFPARSVIDKQRMRSMVADNYMLNRSAVNESTDIFVAKLAEQLDARVIEAKAGAEALTWNIPNNWVVRKGQLCSLKGEVLADFNEHPLHLWTHSISFQGKVDRKTLLSDHVVSDSRRPDEFMYHFRNGYRHTAREWGFSLPHRLVQSLCDEEYLVDIDAELNQNNTMKVVDAFLPGELDDTIFIMAHTCHPGIVSDGIACISIACEIYHWLKKQKKRRYSYRFLFGPEYFGALGWLTHAPKADVENLKFGVYLDMLSSYEPIGFQTSLQANSLMDIVTENVLNSHASTMLKEDYRQLWGNDETFYNGPQFNIPTIGIGRGMHREYHYNTDDLENMSLYHMEESAWYLMRIIEVFESDYVPVLRYQGPLYLSRYDLYIDPVIDPKGHNNLERMQVLADGTRSCMDISNMLGIDFYYVREFFDKIFDVDLIERLDRKTQASDLGNYT